MPPATRTYELDKKGFDDYDYYTEATGAASKFAKVIGYKEVAEILCVTKQCNKMKKLKPLFSYLLQYHILLILLV